MDATCFDSAVEAGQLADLTEFYEKLASPTLKRLIESNDGLYKNLGTVDGKLYGTPEPKSDIEGIPILWIRKDWVEICGWTNAEGGLQPQTYEELEDLLYSFKENQSKIEQQTGVKGIRDFDREVRFPIDVVLVTELADEENEDEWVFPLEGDSADLDDISGMEN